MKEGANSKTLGSIVIPRAWGILKCLVHVSTQKGIEDAGVNQMLSRATVALHMKTANFMAYSSYPPEKHWHQQTEGTKHFHITT